MVRRTAPEINTPLSRPIVASSPTPVGAGRRLRDAPPRRARFALALGAAAVAMMFAGAVEILPDAGVALHEGAGLVLLVLALGVLGTALAGRGPPQPSVLALASGGLAALLVMGGVGAGLALGWLPPSLDPLPIAVLGAFVLLELLVAATSRAPRIPAPPP